MTTIPDSRQTVRAFAPVGLAVLAIVVGLSMPFVGLPIAMIAVVGIAAANITNRRLLGATVGAVGLAILVNLVLVMMALPAARQLVQGV